MSAMASSTTPFAAALAACSDSELSEEIQMAAQVGAS